MKRLLAYLFIVLGLSLTFSVNAKADIAEVCTGNAGTFVKFFSNSEEYQNTSRTFTELEQRVWDNLHTCYVILKSDHEKFYNKIDKKKKTLEIILFDL